MANNLAMAASLTIGRLPLEPGRPVDHQAGGLDVGGHLGDHPLDGLELGDGPVELHALFGISHRFLEGPLRQATAMAAMASRPAFSVVRNCLKPSFSLPSKFSAGMRQSSKKFGSQRSLQPHLLFVASRKEARRPFFDNERRDPRVPLSASVLAATTTTSASEPLVMNCFWPLMTH